MLKEDVDLAPHTHVQIGGRAEAFWEIKSRADLEEALGWGRERGIEECVVIGGGANLLVNDERSYPMVVKLERQFGAVREEGDRVVAEAGIPLTRLVRSAVQGGWGGLEQLAGIPGTLGGAVVMNAGIPGFETHDLLVEVRGLDRSGRERSFARGELAPTYRHGNVPPDVIVTEAAFERRAGDPAVMAASARRLKDDRRAKQPLQFPSFGSTFMNPPARNGTGGAARPGPSGWGGGAAGALLERAGVKGEQRGGAQISELHANWIVNRGGARAADVLELMIMARSRVAERFGVWLVPEVRLVGFERDAVAPLLAAGEASGVTAEAPRP